MMVPTATRILVPTDFSPTADAALAYAKTLAARLDASLHLVHVFTDPHAASTYVPEVYAPVPPETHERALATAQERLRERLDAEEERRFRGSLAILTGLTANEIVKHANEHDIDLIVMGTHGRRGIAHFVLGSVAEHVVRISRCPVLTVHYAHVAALQLVPATSTAEAAA
jgi:nucleotide-binding universal stress UspA family protein